MLRCSSGVLMSFKGKKALVTGSSRGIGRGIALKLAERGAQVAIHYYRNQEAAQAALEQIRGLGSDGFLVQADVCRPDEVRGLFQQVRSEFGSLDIFVSNARTEAPTFYEAPWRSLFGQVGHRCGLPGESIPSCSARGSSADVEWRKDYRDHLRTGRTVWKLAAVGCHGTGEISFGSASAVFRGCAGPPGHHREHDQPGVD
jgi:NAD(P)-dependent dehydrogenase (short-subunit alcohol dehydrogenase family)